MTLRGKHGAIESGRFTLGTFEGVESIWKDPDIDNAQQWLRARIKSNRTGRVLNVDIGFTQSQIVEQVMPEVEEPLDENLTTPEKL